MIGKWALCCIGAFFLAFAAGCDNGGDTGRLTLRVTDSPVTDATHIWIKFDAVEVKPDDGPPLWFDLTATRRFDLLALTDGFSATLLEGIELEAGRYNWIRLYVNLAPENLDPATIDFSQENFSYVVIGATPYPLVIPSGAETGLKLNRPFVVPAGGTADFTVDFDMRKSLHEAVAGRYILRPTLRIVDNVVVGQIVGQITGFDATHACADGTVYVFAGDVVPDDVDAIAPDPVTAARAREEEGMCVYTAAFLEPGLYTVAFTWDGALDDPALDDALAFPFNTTALVTANTTATVDIDLSAAP